MDRLEAILIAGPNGAGKTTFAREYLPVQHPAATFLNADEIQHEKREIIHPFRAGKELLRRLAKLEAARGSFAIETTLASRNYARAIPRWRDLGYRVTLHFIELPSSDYAIQRVASRVAAGGHYIPERDVIRRFSRGLEFFSSLYTAIVDEWYHWKSDEGGLRLVDQK